MNRRRTTAFVVTPVLCPVCQDAMIFTVDPPCCPDCYDALVGHQYISDMTQREQDYLLLEADRAMCAWKFKSA